MGGRHRLRRGTHHNLLHGGKSLLKYLLRDEFITALSAGNVNGTSAEPGPGVRTVIDTTNQLTIMNGLVDFGSGNGQSDPGLWWSPQARVVGKIFLIDVIPNSGATPSIDVGWDGDQTGTALDYLWFNASGDLKVSVHGTTNQTVGTFTDLQTYTVAFVMRAAGNIWFIKGGTEYPTWTMLFLSETASGGRYPTVQATAAGTVFTADDARVPDAAWLSAPRVSDGFADSNGTSLDAHITDGAGHPEGVAGGLGAGGASYSWTEQSGDWDIQANRANPDGAAIATVDAGVADVIIDCTINGGAADQPAIVLRFLDTNNYWYLQADRANNQLELHEYNATVDTVRANTAATINNATDYALRVIASGQTIYGYINGLLVISYGSAALNESATVHGIRAENTVGEFDNWVCYPKGTGGEFTTLDRY